MEDRSLARLYAGEREGLSRTAARIVGGDDAEDVVHDAFVAYLTCDPEARRPGAWLQRTVRNRALNRVRGPDALPLHEVPDERASPERDAEQQALRDVIVRALGALPERSARALVLREVEGVGYKEIAADLGVRVPHAHLIVHRARRRLGQEIVRSLAESMGVAGCAPALEAMAGLGKGRSGHSPHPCADCRPVWEELLSLRGLRALWPVGPGLQRLVDPVRLRLIELGEPAGQAAAAVVLSTALVLSPQGSAPTDAPGPETETAVPTPVPERVAEEPDEPTSSGADVVTVPQETPGTATGGGPPPQDDAEEVTSTEEASVTQDDDHAQAEADTADDGRAGAVVCEPLEPCPPPGEEGEP